MARTKQIQPKPQALDPLPTGTHAILRQGFDAVAYHIPTAPSTDGLPLKTVIAVPRHSAWTSGLHFHASHTEYLRLVKGTIFVELNGRAKLFSILAGGEVDPRNGQLVQDGLVIEIPRCARHKWGRLERQNRSPLTFVRGTLHTHGLPEDWTEEAVVEEWTNPSDITKPLFFWNLNGIINNTPGDAILPKRQAIAKAILGRLWVDLQLFVVFWELDNWPVFGLPRNVSPASDSYLRTSRVIDAAEMACSFVMLLFARLVAFLLGLRAVEQGRTPVALWEAYKNSSRDL